MIIAIITFLLKTKFFTSVWGPHLLAHVHHFTWEGQDLHFILLNIRHNALNFSIITIYDTDLLSISMIIILSSIDSTILLPWALDLVAIHAAQQLVPARQLLDECSLRMHKLTTWSQFVLWPCIYFAPWVQIIKGSDNWGWTVVGF